MIEKSLPPVNQEATGIKKADEYSDDTDVRQMNVYKYNAYLETS